MRFKRGRCYQTKLVLALRLLVVRPRFPGSDDANWGVPGNFEKAQTEPVRIVGGWTVAQLKC